MVHKWVKRSLEIFLCGGNSKGGNTAKIVLSSTQINRKGSDTVVDQSLGAFRF